MWYLGVFGLLLSLVSASWVLNSRQRRKDWRETMERAGLIVEEPSRWSVSPRLKALAGAVEVRLAKEGTDVLVTAALEGPPDLAEVVIRRELIKLRASREIETGDEAFDRTFFVKGWRPFVLALLDGPLRHMLLQFGDDGRLSLAGGELQLEVPEARLARLLPAFLDLCQALTRNPDIPRCLADNVSRDPSPGVRQRSLSVLMEVYPGYPSTVEALRAASKDVNPEARLQAALGLGAEGRDVLLSLAENVDDDALSARAVAALGRELPFRRGRALLRRSLKQRRTATVAACLEALGSHGSIAATTLEEAMMREGTELAVIAARTLGKFGGAAAQPALVAALARPDPALRAAAAEALGRVGSADAVLPLQELAERSLLGSNLRRTALQAVDEIQARLAGAERGQLSLAAADAGQLSIAPDAAGQLSLPTEQERG